MKRYDCFVAKIFIVTVDTDPLGCELYFNCYYCCWLILNLLFNIPAKNSPLVVLEGWVANWLLRGKTNI
jgi:hypothetical protein